MKEDDLIRQATTSRAPQPDGRGQPVGAAHKGNHDGGTPPQTQRTPSGFELMYGLIRSSGIYAIASIAAPLVSLLLSPYLTHTLSRTDYGALAVLSTSISLLAGITQLGLGSGFFRAYSYEYDSEADRRSVISTVILILAVFTLPLVAAAIAFAPTVAKAVLGSAAYGQLIVIAALAVLAQNMTVPGLALLRAQSRASAYAAMSVASLLVNLVGTIILVGALHFGIAGALMAPALGYAVMTALTFPHALRRGGLHVSPNIVRSLLAYGLPLGINAVAVWVLQVSDRYLLSRYASLAETGSYDVAYRLGSILNATVLYPFLLAWPVAQFTIAKRSDGPRIFGDVFRWYGALLLFASYALTLVGLAALDILYPPTYQAVGPVIPVVALSTMFGAACSLLGVGIGLQRNTTLALVCFALAASVNFLCNLALIPHYHAMGAALSTLAAYIVLAASTYAISNRLYPAQLDVQRFAMAVVVGTAVFVAGYSPFLLGAPTWGWLATSIGLVVYGTWLTAFMIPPRQLAQASQLVRQHVRGFVLRRDAHTGDQNAAHSPPERGSTPRVCMHVLGSARTDVRVLKEATALAEAGLAVSLVDVEPARVGRESEEIEAIPTTHITMASWFEPTRFKPWFLVKAARMFAAGTLKLLRNPADVYHAHDFMALPACFVAARLRRKPLVYDAHELPLVDPSVTRWQWLCRTARRALTVMVRRCAGLITVSPPIAGEIHRSYGVPDPVVVRNIPAFRPPMSSDRLRQHLGLGPEIHIALYQGNLQADRGLDALVRAARFVAPDIVVVMMGKGGCQTQLATLIAREGVADRIRILPPVPYQELLDWTASADIGLILNPPTYSPNVRMCLPNKLFEYLMAGVPVLAAPLEAVADVIEANEVGWVLASLEPDQIGRAINAMMADREALARMRHSALEASERDLRWDVESDRLIHLYREVLEVRWPTAR